MAQIDGIDIASEISSEVTMMIAVEYYVQGTTWIAQANADGIASRTIVQPLAKNALVRLFTVRVGATRADGTTLANSGQVRLQAEVNGSKILVVDFGMLRTVSGIGRVEGAPSLSICSLRAFRGDAFDDKDLYHEDCGEPVILILTPGVDPNVFETKTDRVRIKVKTTASLETLSSKLFLQFPDLPSDLDIRVNGGPTVWTAPGVAQPSTRGWDDTTHRVADLTAALAALTGDPRDASAFNANITLAARIPGSLSMDSVTMDVAYLARIAFGDSEESTLVLDQEGEYDIVLPLPSWVAAVQEVRFTVAGTVSSERILEPVGPPRALQSAGAGAAYDLLLDVDHAGAARLDPAKFFAELVAVRLPLRAGVDGAEVRAVLYQGTDDGPTIPVSGGTSTPVDLTPAAADAGDVWTSFPMPNPVKLDHALTYWAVVVVGRGAVSWSLGSFPSGAPVPIRRGAAIGPWHPLPNVIVDGTSLGARIRAVGKAPPTTPVAPLLASVVGHETTQIAVTPLPKGVSAAWVPPGAVVGTVHPSILPTVAGSAKSITLRLTSRMTGTVKLSAVDVVATK